MKATKGMQVEEVTLKQDKVTKNKVRYQVKSQKGIVEGVVYLQKGDDMPKKLKGEIGVPEDLGEEEEEDEDE